MKYLTNGECSCESGPTYCWVGVTEDGGPYFTIKSSGWDISRWKTCNSGEKYCLEENETSTTMCYDMFYKCSSLTSLDLSKMDLSEMTNMAGMFMECRNLSSITFGNRNLENLTNIAGIFSGCYKLGNVNVNNWNVSRITNGRQIFMRCSSMTSIDISKWQCQLESLDNTFCQCFNALDIKSNGLDTSHVSSMAQCFAVCSGLTFLDLSNWETSMVSSTTQMFAYCTSLRHVKLNKFVATNFSSYNYMFKDCPTNIKITCKSSFKNWCISNQSKISLPSSVIWDIVP